MDKWFNFRRIGVGLTPYSTMGWVLTGLLVVGIVLMKAYFRRGGAKLPTLYYVLLASALVVYAVIAFITANRER